jgi:hypothetical protein
MKLRSGSSSSFIASISRSSRSTCSWTMRSVISTARNPRRAWRDRRRDRTARSGCAPASPRARSSVDVEQRDADRAVGLVDVADRGARGDAPWSARAVDEAGLAGVAGARVDAVELDQVSPSRGDEQEQHDEDDRHRLEHDALAHQILAAHAGHVLALRHADHALDEHEEGRAAASDDQDDEEGLHGAYLGSRGRISSRQMPRTQIGRQFAGSAPAARSSGEVGAPLRLASRCRRRR